LPQPISGEKNNEENLLNRIDVLRMVNASCRYYDMAARAAGGSADNVRAVMARKTANEGVFPGRK